MGFFKELSTAGRRTPFQGHNFEPEVVIGGLSPADVQEQNAIVKAWVPKVRSKLRSSARWFSDGKTESFVMRGTGSKRRKEGKLAESIQSKTKAEFGLIDTITYRFERHGVFVHKGVGRGYNANGSFVTRTAKGNGKRARVAVEWFNPVLDQNLPELAEKIIRVNSDAVIKSALMKIK